MLLTHDGYIAFGGVLEANLIVIKRMLELMADGVISPGMPNWSNNSRK